MQRYWATVRPFVVRPALPEDGEAISVLTHRSLGYEVVPDQTRARVARLIQKPQNRIWVAEQQGQVTAYLHGADYETCYRAPQKNVVSLAVDPACQGMGMGRALLPGGRDMGPLGKVRRRAHGHRHGAHRRPRLLPGLWLPPAQGIQKL